MIMDTLPTWWESEYFAYFKIHQIQKCILDGIWDGVMRPICPTVEALMSSEESGIPEQTITAI